MGISHDGGFQVSNTLVTRMVEVIENEYADVVTLRRLATDLRRQPAYLGRVFLKETGFTVREYLTRVRLDHAETLIREGVKIEAVSLTVGYRSKKNFYQQFKRRYGVTPIPYRLHSMPTEPSSDSVGRTRYLEISHPVARATAADTGHQPPMQSDIPNAPEPVLGQLGTVVRASNKAWRLAVRIQRTMAARFSGSRVPMLLTGDDGRYVAANQAALALTGYSSTELCGLPAASLFSEFDKGDVRCVWQLLLSVVRHETKATSATIRHKAGSLIPVHLVTFRNWLWGSEDMSNMVGGVLAKASPTESPG